MRLFKRKGKTPAKGADAGDAKGQVDAGDAIRRCIELTEFVAKLADQLTKAFDQMNDVVKIMIEARAEAEQATDGAQKEGTV